jgi:uncharacterized membrane protein
MRPQWTEGAIGTSAAAFALVPKVICPFCVPALTALLSSVGLSYLLLTATYLLPMTAAVLSVAVGSLFVTTRTDSAFGPFWIGLAASIGILIGKFSLNSAAVMYGGVALLIAASVWSVARHRATAGVCSRAFRQNPVINIYKATTKGKHHNDTED